MTNETQKQECLSWTIKLTELKKNCDYWKPSSLVMTIISVVMWTMYGLESYLFSKQTEQ